MAKLPAPDPARLDTADAEYADPGRLPTHWWRIHATAGQHPAAWDDLRTWGPVAKCRFDPHEPPPRHQAEGVMYLAADLASALAEVFQENRIINPTTNHAYLTGFAPTRGLRLLDLTGDWPLHIGASHNISSGRKDLTRTWARALRRRWPDADGLLHLSSMNGGTLATLWNPARSSLPDRPDFSEALAHPGLRDHLAAAAKRIGYELV
jgi:hypothetical protein